MPDLTLGGATRLIPIIGDPIAQVKSPAGVTAAMQEAGRNAVCVPIHVASDAVAHCVAGLADARNVDAIIVTVPHKFAAYRMCATATERAHALGSVQTMRRNADGSWHGDQLDGLGHVEGMRRNGAEFAGRAALLVGAGGAGSAIGLALLDAGVSRLAIHDGDITRRDALIAKLATRHPGRAGLGSVDPRGYALVTNATPSGMRAGDPLPVDVTGLDASTFVSDVVTVPAVTPLLEAARARGCRTSTGADMFAAVNALMIAFMLEAGR